VALVQEVLDFVRGVACAEVLRLADGEYRQAQRRGRN